MFTLIFYTECYRIEKPEMNKINYNFVKLKQKNVVVSLLLLYRLF